MDWPPHRLDINITEALCHLKREQKTETARDTLRMSLQKSGELFLKTTEESYRKLPETVQAVCKNIGGHVNN